MKTALIISVLSLLLFPERDMLPSIKVYAGTPVYLSLNEEVSSEKVEVGHTVELFVDSDVIVNGQIVIATGSIAEGRVTKVVKSCGNRCHLSCSEIAIKAETVQAVDGQRIYLRSRSLNIKANCITNEAAVAILGLNLSARILNNVRIQP